jgi:hypothetical protein
MHLGKLTATNLMSDVSINRVNAKVWVRILQPPSHWPVTTADCRVVQAVLTIPGGIEEKELLNAIGDLAPRLGITSHCRQTIFQVEAQGRWADEAKQALVDELLDAGILVPTGMAGLHQLARPVKPSERPVNMDQVNSYCDWNTIRY